MILSADQKSAPVGASRGVRLKSRRSAAPVNSVRMRSSPAESGPDVLPQETGFPEVYRAHVRGVWRALSALGVRGDDLNDACQEVFLVVHRRLSEFDGRHKLSTWIHAICVNVARSWRRKVAARREEPDPRPDERAGGRCTEAEAAARESLEQLRRLLDVLDDDKRAVFVLYEVQEMSIREVAEAVGCPLQTAYSRYRAARSILDRAVAQHAGDLP
jgi:RNA polymerase sigma-70 factor (ECF subfamily)